MKLNIKINQKIIYFPRPFTDEWENYWYNLYGKIRKFFQKHPKLTENYYHIKAGGTYETRPIKT